MTHHTSQDSVTSRAPSTDPAYERWTLTAELERNLRREHHRAHPDGLTPISRRPCTICMLLDALSLARTAVCLPGDDLLYARLRGLNDGQRIDIRGRLIDESLHVDKCHDCGMGLTHAAEYHPYVACQVFKRTHDSREVWRELRRLAWGRAC